MLHINKFFAIRCLLITIKDEVFYFAVISINITCNVFIIHIFNYNYMYNEQDNVSWLHIELLSNTLFLKKLRNIFERYSQEFGSVDFYFIRKFENR